MAWKEDHFQRDRRRQEHEDWMDEDDLLEENWRFKIQRGSARHGGDNRAYRYDQRQDPWGNQGHFHKEFQGEPRREAWAGYQQQPHGVPRDDFRPGDPSVGGSRGTPFKEDDRRTGMQDPPQGRGLKQSGLEGMPKSSASKKCFRCTKDGRHQSECTNDPICYKCKKSGHMAAECAGIHHKKLKMYGFGISGQGFYSIEIPDAKCEVDTTRALINIIEGDATEEKLKKELRNVINDKWDFNVKKVEKDAYTAVFPDEKSLDTFSKVEEMELPLSKLNIKIKKSIVDPASSSVLQSTWIKIYGIPNFAKEEEIVKEVISIVAEPIKVDEFSLLRDKPVRVRANCKNPSIVDGWVEVFFNGVGYELEFVVEGSTGGSKGRGGGDPGPGKPDDRHGKRRREDDKDDYDRSRSGNYDKQPKIFKPSDKETDNRQGESQEDSLGEDLVRDGSPTEVEEIEMSDELPIAAFHPDCGEINIANEERDISRKDVQETFEEAIKQNKIIVEEILEAGEGDQNSQKSIVTSQEDAGETFVLRLEKGISGNYQLLKTASSSTCSSIRFDMNRDSCAGRSPVAVAQHESSSGDSGENVDVGELCNASSDMDQLCTLDTKHGDLAAAGEELKPLMTVKQMMEQFKWWRVDGWCQALLEPLHTWEQKVVEVLHMIHCRQLTEPNPKKHNISSPTRFCGFNIALFDLDKESEVVHGPLFGKIPPSNYCWLDDLVNVISISVAESDVPYPINIYGTVLARAWKGQSSSHYQTVSTKVMLPSIEIRVGNIPPKALGWILLGRVSEGWGALMCYGDRI